MFVELKNLLTPYLDTAKVLQDMQSVNPRDTNQTSQSTLISSGSRHESIDRASKDSSEEVPISHSSALFDGSILMDHLTAIRNMQLQSADAQRSLVSSIDTIRDELGILAIGKDVQIRRTLQEQGERLTKMTRSFEDIRLAMQELVIAQQDNSTNASIMVRRPALIPLPTEKETVSNQSVLLLVSFDLADYSQVYPPHSIIEVLSLAFAVSGNLMMNGVEIQKLTK